MAKETPVNWTPWLQEALVRKANLISMGLVELDSSAPITQGGKLFTRPIQANLRDISSPEKVTESTTITPATASDMKENVVVCHIGDGYYETEYDRITRGNAGLDKLMLQNAEVVNDSIQDYIVAAIKGAFTTALLSTNVYDGTSVGTGEFTPDMAINAAESIFDEDEGKFDTYIMHSKMYAKLKIDGFINYANPSSFAATILSIGQIPIFLGKKVVINNTLCANEGTTEAPIYPIYMSQGQPFYLAWQNNVRVYEQFHPQIGGGRHDVYWYADFAPAVKGVSWTHTAFDPSTTDLQTGSYWTKIAETKHIKILKIKSLYIPTV